MPRIKFIGASALVAVLTLALPTAAVAAPNDDVSLARYAKIVSEFTSTHPQPVLTATPGTREFDTQQLAMYEYWLAAPWHAVYGQHGADVSQVTVEMYTGSDGIDRAAVSVVVTPSDGAAIGSDESLQPQAVLAESCKTSGVYRHCFQIPTYPTLEVKLHRDASFSATGKHRLGYQTPTTGCAATDAVVLYTSPSKTIPPWSYIATSVNVGVSAQWTSTWISSSGNSRACY